MRKLLPCYEYFAYGDSHVNLWPSCNLSSKVAIIRGEVSISILYKISQSLRSFEMTINKFKGIMSFRPIVSFRPQGEIFATGKISSRKKERDRQSPAKADSFEMTAGHGELTGVLSAFKSFKKI